jgi:23S rRNA pseudouridine2604 synthase
MTNRPSVSLNKYISDTGLCSRREADRMIEECRVSLNGKDAVKGDRVYEGDEVVVDGSTISKKKRKPPIYIAFNKPVRVVTTTDTNMPGNIISYINHKERIFPIGRLDKLSEGLIFLTNDGDIVNKVLRAGNNHEKEYVVTVDKPINNAFVEKMSKGIPLDGEYTKKCKVEQIGPAAFRIILTQGLNRQVRRMCEYLRYNVVKLKRVRIMHIALKDLKPGAWRYFTQAEIDQLNEMVKDSSKTDDAAVKKKK